MSVFITIEGIEGAGKSTLRAKLTDWLNQQVPELVVTREPGATELGKSLRSLLLDDSVSELDPIAELLLFFADRAQHLHEIIRPALERGAAVLCDRYIHSTLAYQGYGRELPLDRLNEITEFTTGGLNPDLVLLLDLDAEAGLRRAAGRSRRGSISFDMSTLGPGGGDESWNRFEQQQLAFHQRVRNGFLELAKAPGSRFAVLDAAKPEEEVAAQAYAAVERVLKQSA